MTGDAYTVVGGGAIGGTLAYRLARAGHSVTVVDADAAHTAAMRTHGLTVTRPDGTTETAHLAAAGTPEELAELPLDQVLLAVKAQATEEAMAWIAPRLSADGYVVSLQNGFNEEDIARHVGAGRTVPAFVNIFADVVDPGVIRDGGAGALVVGSPQGADDARVLRLVDALRGQGPAEASGNVEGFLWAKAGFGAMLAASALADAPMADLLDRHRTAAHAVAREVFDVADRLGVRLESFDAFEAPAFRRDAAPEVREGATDRLVAWLRTMPKDRSGIWRDLAVRRRPVEVTTHYATVFTRAEEVGVETPVLRAVVEGLRKLESDPSLMSEQHLDVLDRLATGPSRLPAAPLLDDAQARSVHGWLDAHREELLADLAAYTRIESPSDDTEALAACLAWLREWLDASLGEPAEEELLERPDAGDILVRRYPARGPAASEDGDPRPVLLLCHYDTVWPLGTLAEWPFALEGDRISGPGVFDMKAGLVQAVWALRALDALELPRPAVTLVLNGDEETGSLHSSEALVAEAAHARAALVFEASADGAVKTSRKGVGLFTLRVTGREAHAGLDPTAGASAVVEAAHQIIRLGELGDTAAGTSVNVGVVHGGTRSNVTAGAAEAHLDVRVASVDEQRRVAAGLAALRPADSRTSVDVTGGWNRPVFARTPDVERLYELARQCAAPLGVELREAAVGGASDGNFVQAAGVPVLDGLGALGSGAHARNEHTTLSGMVERSALAAGVLAAFVQGA
ncbi:2-dehydropantoate 2-reductase [Streptomyces sulphureus]|uniref:2-dehydropantoate 2-reductase n=2 Tax=Streptomyces TaxID=1883 RepID=UPI000366D69B|nr:2-dehydropantoate 2-reductase [Streptomyces sulphureus]